MGDELGESLQRSFDRDAVAVLVVALSETIEPGGTDDPASAGTEELTLALTDLLGNVSNRDAAQGIVQALWEIYARWTIGS
jgi:hypothetical protein